MSRLIRLPVVALASLAVFACERSGPRILDFNGNSGVSLRRPPRWRTGSATDASGVPYWFLTAPKIANEAQPVSITLISPAVAASAEAAAQPYLQGAAGVSSSPKAGQSVEWTFTDSSGLPSRLRLIPAGDGRFFGGWARGSDAAMKANGQDLDAIYDSMTAEDPSRWPEEQYAGLALRVPASWTRGSRMSNATNATMQFRSPPLAVEQGNTTVHGFLTLAREALQAPGDVDAFRKVLKERDTDIAVRLESAPWPGTSGLSRPAGYYERLRSGNTLAATRIARWVTAKDGSGIILTCESNAEVHESLLPWCERVAATVRVP